MSRDRAVTIRIPEALLAALIRAARAEEVTAGEFIRLALGERLADNAGLADPVAQLRRALRRELAAATDWVEAQRRLRARGFVLRRQAAGELWLHTWPLERRLAPLARLGVDPEDLTLRYRAPFPCHGPGGPGPVPAVAAAANAAAEPAPGAATATSAARAA